jgi:hypothetical protein
MCSQDLVLRISPNVCERIVVYLTGFCTRLRNAKMGSRLGIREEHGRTLKATASSLLWNYGMR